MLRCVFSLQQSFCKVEHSFGMIEPFHIILLAKPVGVAAGAIAVGRVKRGTLFGRHRVIAVEINIAADAEMLHTDQVANMIEVIQHMLNGSRLIRRNKDANPSPHISHFLAILGFPTQG
jgi:hypothetical protein